MAITGVGQSQSFAYTGSIQTFTVPFTGLYKLYLIGASGGYHNSVGCLTGLGGVTTQYIKLKKGTVLYVVVGGKGPQANAKTISGGYNGGGGGNYSSVNDNVYIGGGGGATHIATKTGLLPDLSNNRDSVLAVASGGGLTSAGTTPATQTSGNAFGQGASLSGGGWYGGVTSSKLGTPANYGTNSGGSGYLSNTDTYTIDGVAYTSATATRGQTTTPENGSAIITYIAKTFPTIIVDGVTIDKLVFDGVSVETVIFNGTTLS